MIPANEDRRAQQEQRERILEDLKQRAMHALDEDALKRWADDSASILAAWAMQDGVTIEAIQSGTVPDTSTPTLLWQLMQRITCANAPELQRLALSGADRLRAVSAYGRAAEDAARDDMIKDFKSAAKAQFPAMSDNEAAFVALSMATMMLARALALQDQENDRLRAEILAAGGTLPDDKPQD